VPEVSPDETSATAQIRPGVTVRPVTEADLAAVVALLADDPLGATREDVFDLTPYRSALERVREDRNQLLVVAERGHGVVATLQLSFVPGLSRRGADRAVIEAVRVSSGERGNGLGTALIGWAVEQARARGCALVQLTSHESRTGAHRFYRRLGFEASHLGFKLDL
jgi:ribosomal protein S18 acetylase RimI-like enzyme